jgi:PncC family amidohydrolase
LAAQPNLGSLTAKVVSRLRTLRATVGFAESCTGGLLSATLTEYPGVSDVYAGSVVAYAYPVKERLLGVPASMLKVHGAVSVPVARQMAKGARETLDVTWTLSITGIAGPGGGTPQKPVGTVCFGLVGPGVDKVDRQQFDGDRRAIQTASAEHALKMLLAELGTD